MPSRELIVGPTQTILLQDIANSSDSIPDQFGFQKQNSTTLSNQQSLGS